MKKSIAVLAAVGLAATMAVSLAGPAGAKGTPTTTTPGGKAPAKQTSCSAKSSKSAVNYSLTQFFIGANGAAKAVWIDQGQKLVAVLDQANTAAQQLGLLKPGQNTLPVGLTIQCTGKTGANFTYDLVFKDLTTGTTAAPLGLHLTGQAVLKGGKWLISDSAVCDLTQMESAAAGTACFQAVGLPVPPPS